MLRCMEITEAQYQHIASTLPRQRGNVKAYMHNCCTLACQHRRIGNGESSKVREDRGTASLLLR